MNTDRSDILRFLPVGLDVRGKRCLVVGGGPVGTRKALTLAGAGADVTVISPAVTAELAGSIEAGRMSWLRDSFRHEHLRNAFLAVAATDDEALNAEIVRLAVEGGTLVCDASSAERSVMIFGALLRLDRVTVAVFTDGRDPAEARRTRDRIAAAIGRPEPPPESHPR